MARTIVLGSDHGGFELKEFLGKYLAEEGYDIVDVGPHKYDPDDDYPDYADALAEYIGEHRRALGVLICRTGTGVMMAVNRFRFIRGALLYSPASARLAREHEDANVAILGSDAFSDKENIDFLDAFLTAKFAGEERHRRRIGKIS
jgi:ribose 5-phosphate isomerase B